MQLPGGGHLALDGPSKGRRATAARRGWPSILLIAACASQRPPRPERLPPAPPPADPHKLYVELNLGRSHQRPLRDGATAALARIPFVVPRPLNQGGDVELQVEVARLDVIGHETVCDIKILALRLPGRDLFGAAEGSARAGGTHEQASHDCVESLGESLISGKVRALLHKRLDEKR